MDDGRLPRFGAFVDVGELRADSRILLRRGGRLGQSFPLQERIVGCRGTQSHQRTL